MDWDFFIETIIPVATLICSVFGVFGFFRSLRKPKARLRFTNGKKKITFCPHYCRKISDKYYTDPPTNCYDSHAYEELLEQYNKKLAADNNFHLPFRLTNTGKLQLENYRVEIHIVGGRYGVSFYNNVSGGVTLNKKNPCICYHPSEAPAYLNQNDTEDFFVSFTPDPDVDTYELHWRIIAKDCTKKGKLKIKLTPTVEEYDEFHFVNCRHDIPEGAEVVKDLKPYITQLAEKLT